MPATHTRSTTPNPEVLAILDAIAARDLVIDGLNARGDHPDTYACAVENLRAVMLAAYEAGHRAARKPRPANTDEVHGDLVLTRKPAARDAGGWTAGRIGAYRFEALVFPQHADLPSYEIGRSRISKLCVRRLADDAEVFNWDRGLDRPAADADVQAAVDAIAARLAEVVFGPARD